MSDMIRREMVGLPATSGSLKQQLGISTRSTLHQWKMQGGADTIKGFTSNYQRVKQASRIFSRLGYVAIGLEIVGGVANIRKACTLEPGSEACRRIKFTQTGRTTGSILGGALGGGAAYGACNMLFGVEPFGSSLLWCGIVAGGVGSFGGSKALGAGGEQAGEFIYEANVQ